MKKILSAVLLLCFACGSYGQVYPAFGERVARSDSSSQHEDYVYILPNQPGVVVFMGQMYSQPDSITLLGDDGEVLMATPYIGDTNSIYNLAIQGYVEYHDGVLRRGPSSSPPDCFYAGNVAQYLTSGTWAVVWNATGMDTITLRLSLKFSVSDWELKALWYPLPQLVPSCDKYAVITPVDTLWYDSGLPVLFPVQFDCFQYDWLPTEPQVLHVPTLEISPDSVVFRGQPVTVTVNNYDGLYDWKYSDGRPFAGAETIQPNGDTIIQITNGCDTLIQWIYVLGMDGLYVPNVFAPSSVSGNDRWSPQWQSGKEPANHATRVYDRFGSLVVQLSPGESWDGNGYPPGVYTYVVFVHGRAPVRGNVTLVR